jgi:hypothetical protein
MATFSSRFFKLDDRFWADFEPILVSNSQKTPAKVPHFPCPKCADSAERGGHLPILGDFLSATT